MDAKVAASGTVDAILDAQSGFASSYRRRAVREHCVGVENRISELETQVADLQRALVEAQKAIKALLPDLT